MFNRKHVETLAFFSALLAQISFFATSQSSEIGALEDTPKFTTLSVEDGLSSNVVHTLAQDQLGFIWLGTRSGLNRYDGSEITTFYNDPDNANSIGHNWTFGMLVDRDGFLWSLSWGGGLTRVDLEHDIYTHFTHDENDPNSLDSNNGWGFFQDSGGALWVGTDVGLNRLHEDGSGFTRFHHDPENPRSLAGGSGVSSIQEDKQGRLWVGVYGGGVSVLDAQRKSFQHYKHNPDNPNSLSDNNVWSMLIDRQGEVWIGSENGISRYNPAIDEFRHYRNRPGDPGSLAADTVLSMLEDSQGRIWVGTWGGGIGLFDRESERFQTLKHDPLDPDSPPDNAIPVIFEDRDGAIWFGSENGAIKFDAQEHRFAKHAYRPHDPNSVSGPTVEAFHLDASGQLWVATKSEGLNRFDPARRRNTHFRHDPTQPNNQARDQIRSIVPDGETGFWLATGSGLDYFDRQSGRFLDEPIDPEGDSGLSNGNILDLTIDANGELWTALYGSGVDRYDPASGQVTLYRSVASGSQPGLAAEWVSVVEAASDGSIWVGGEGGLSQIDSESGEIRNVDIPNSGLPDSNISSLHEDQAGVIWVGTNSGLSRYDADNRRFEQFRDTEEEAGTHIMGILSDAEGYIWISTNNGLSRLDPKSGKFRTFNAADNLQSKTFRQNASYASPQGEMFFGGVKGFNSFFPAHVIVNPNPPSVAFTEFLINGQAVTVGSESPLKKNISHAQSVTLSHDQSSFALKFTALNMRTPENNRYAYMLEGFDGDWRFPGNNRTVNYTNLDPGSYTMRVKAANNDGLWNETSRDLKLTVLPAWWQSWWAYSLYLLLLIAAVWGFIAWRLFAAEQQKKLLTSQVVARTEQLRQATEDAEKAREKSQAANQAKSVFLANMSHELRTPLNAILGFSDMMARDQTASSDQRESLDVINRSGQHLLTLINDVLDVSKIEAGRVKLDPVPCDLHRLLRDIEDMIKLQADSKDLSFSVETDPGLPRSILFDIGKLRQVLINLLANAIKFTEDGGVTLRAAGNALSDGNWRLRFDVEDSGVGIPADEIETIFEPFEQVSHSPYKQQGAGLGLAICNRFVALMGGKISVESSPHKGTTFHIEVPAEATDIIESTESIRLPTGLVEGQPQWRVLIAEDEPNNRLLLKRQLGSVGFHVRDVENGEQAIQQFQDWQPHLIWMDMRMPVMTGQEATVRIRQLTGGDTVKIVAITASSFKEQRESILQAGCDDVLHKPYLFHQIFAVMGDLLGARYLYEEDEKIQPKKTPASLTFATLKSLPAELRHSLRDAALLFDVDGTNKAIQRVYEIDSAIADDLQQLANEFRFEKILELLGAASVLPR